MYGGCYGRTWVSSLHLGRSVGGRACRRMRAGPMGAQVSHVHVAAGETLELCTHCGPDRLALSLRARAGLSSPCAVRDSANIFLVLSASPPLIMAGLRLAPFS